MLNFEIRQLIFVMLRKKLWVEKSEKIVLLSLLTQNLGWLLGPELIGKSVSVCLKLVTGHCLFIFYIWKSQGETNFWHSDYQYGAMAASTLL